jgi:cytochrome c oxidase subunit 2
MNGTQILLTVSYFLLLAGSAVFAVVVIRSTSARQRAREFDPNAAAEKEGRFAWLIVGLLVALTIATAFAIPYPDTSAGDDGQVVLVDAFQFGWRTVPAEVPVDTEIEFRTRSADVQHGFGLYDGSKLLAQVQVPANTPGGEAEFGDEQRLVYTFDHPGKYDILCLEFCGSKHQAMAAQIEVTE